MPKSMSDGKSDKQVLEHLSELFMGHLLKIEQTRCLTDHTPSHRHTEPHRYPEPATSPHYEPLADAAMLSATSSSIHLRRPRLSTLINGRQALWGMTSACSYCKKVMWC